jgi:hypothetical protein
MACWQFRGVKDTTPDTLIRQLVEEPLHLIQPGASWRGVAALD